MMKVGTHHHFCPSTPADDLSLIESVYPDDHRITNSHLFEVDQCNDNSLQPADIVISLQPNLSYPAAPCNGAAPVLSDPGPPVGPMSSMMAVNLQPGTAHRNVGQVSQTAPSRSALPSSIVGSEIELARRLGVRFDSSNAAWVARWVDPHSEKKKSRWFSVAKYGELSARRLAIQACLQNMKAADFSNFRDLQDVLASFTTNSLATLAQPGVSPDMLMLNNGTSSSNNFVSPYPQHHFGVNPNYFAAAAAAIASMSNFPQSNDPSANMVVCQGIPQDQAVLGVCVDDSGSESISVKEPKIEDSEQTEIESRQDLLDTANHELEQEVNPTDYDGSQQVYQIYQPQNLTNTADKNQNTPWHSAQNAMMLPQAATAPTDMYYTHPSEQLYNSQSNPNFFKIDSNVSENSSKNSNQTNAPYYHYGLYHSNFPVVMSNCNDSEKSMQSSLSAVPPAYDTNGFGCDEASPAASTTPMYSSQVKYPEQQSGCEQIYGPASAHSPASSTAYNVQYNQSILQQQPTNRQNYSQSPQNNGPQPNGSNSHSTISYGTSPYDQGNVDHSYNSAGTGEYDQFHQIQQTSQPSNNSYSDLTTNNSTDYYQLHTDHNSGGTTTPTNNHTYCSMQHYTTPSTSPAHLIVPPSTPGQVVNNGYSSVSFSDLDIRSDIDEDISQQMNSASQSSQGVHQFYHNNKGEDFHVYDDEYQPKKRKLDISSIGQTTACETGDSSQLSSSPDLNTASNDQQHLSQHMYGTNSQSGPDSHYLDENSTSVTSPHHSDSNSYQTVPSYLYNYNMVDSNADQSDIANNNLSYYYNPNFSMLPGQSSFGNSTQQSTSGSNSNVVNAGQTYMQPQQHFELASTLGGFYMSNPYHQFGLMHPFNTHNDMIQADDLYNDSAHNAHYKRIGGVNGNGLGSSSGFGTHHGLSAKMTCERGLHYSKNYRGNQECWIAVWNTKGGRIMHEAFDVTIMGFDQAKSKAREARDAAHSNNLAVAENSRPSWKSHSNTGIPHVSLDSQQLRFRAHKFGRRLCRSFSFGRRRGSFASRESAFDAAVLWLIQTPTEEEIAAVSGAASKMEEPL